jgi:hypothetical protein
MGYRGLIDPKGELFAYIYGGTLYTLDDEATGRLEGEYIVDMEGTRIWRVAGDAVYDMEGRPIGYFGEARPPEYDF